MFYFEVRLIENCVLFCNPSAHTHTHSDEAHTYICKQTPTRIYIYICSMFTLACYKICIKNLSHSSKMVEKFTSWMATWPRKVCPHADRCSHTQTQHTHTRTRGERGQALNLNCALNANQGTSFHPGMTQLCVALFQEIDKSKFIIGRAEDEDQTRPRSTQCWHSSAAQLSSRKLF